ncbi:MAG: hypothetical protein H8D45_19120 [Bacteroidetes bacterium]|nr:hypothetical protein [Bacteroidota bacterium]
MKIQDSARATNDIIPTRTSFARLNDTVGHARLPELYGWQVKNISLFLSI